jgi:hypothetical protein
MKITKTCRVNGTMRSMDLDIEGVGILYVEDSCQVSSESFLLLSTTSGYANFTLTPGLVVTSELPVLLSEEETQVLVSHQDQADGTLGALDALMTRRLVVGQQHEIRLRDLLAEIHDQHEQRHYNWVIAVITVTIIVLLMYLTSRCWRQSLLEFVSRYVLRRTGVPARVAVPQPRGARTCTLPLDDEDCEMELKSIMGAAEGTSGEKIADPRVLKEEPAALPESSTGGTGADRVATVPTLLGVRYSQPGRYQP